MNTEAHHHSRIAPFVGNHNGDGNPVLATRTRTPWCGTHTRTALERCASTAACAVAWAVVAVVAAASAIFTLSPSWMDTASAAALPASAVCKAARACPVHNKEENNHHPGTDSNNTALGKRRFGAVVCEGRDLQTKPRSSACCAVTRTRSYCSNGMR